MSIFKERRKYPGIAGEERGHGIVSFLEERERNRLGIPSAVDGTESVMREIVKKPELINDPGMAVVGVNEAIENYETLLFDAKVPREDVEVSVGKAKEGIKTRRKALDFIQTVDRVVNGTNTNGSSNSSDGNGGDTI